ncbi:uncharacterized protein [Halyomorpha halys]|uniref:uncharacterized protein n=1 Tax=Halyomorpha halys TaxID=286706 RepID=UPI0006D4FB88|nr:uncharacterized protein LOC106680554 [Halyomorpha halys]
MRTLGLPVLTILATISSFSCLAAPLEQNSNSVEKPKAYFIPHVRAKREFGGIPDFTLSGKGSNKYGFLKESIAGTIWESENTRIDGRGSVQVNWAEGIPPNTVYTIGGTITQNIYRDAKDAAELNLQVGFDDTIVGHESNGQYNAGITFTYHFPSDNYD